MSVTVSGGQTYVLSGTQSGIAVQIGGTLEVTAGGVAEDPVISAGGSAIVMSGGVASGATLAYMASESVLSGGIDQSATVVGGAVAVFAGGTAIDSDAMQGGVIVVSSGGTEVVEAGGSAAGVELLPGAKLVAGSGTSMTDLSVLGSGAVLSLVGRGVSATYTTLMSGGQEIVGAGGFAYGDTVYEGCTVTVASGGLVWQPTLLGFVAAGSDAVPVGANLIVEAGGSAVGAGLSFADHETVLSGGSVYGTRITSQSVLKIEFGGTAGNDMIGPSGTLVLAGGAALDGPIAFTTGTYGGNGDSELVISWTTMPDVPISGFDVSGISQNDTIDLAGIPFTAGGSASVDSATGILSVVENGATYDLHLAQLPNIVGERLTTAADGLGGTAVFAAFPCFAAGTRLLTANGTAAVEWLAPGDHVRLTDGGLAPIVWVGHRASRAGAIRARPTCIRCGSRRMPSASAGRSAACGFRPIMRCSSRAC